VENVKHWLPLLLWAVLVFTLSSIPGTSFPKSALWNYDKLLHAAEYATGGFLCCLALGPRLWWVAALLVSLYGATDELHQILTPMRSCDWRDWIADTAGGTLGALSFWLWRRAR
jgi:VanZ family protein